MTKSEDAILDTALRDAAESGQGFTVDVDGYEGPLHVLLALAREQKVDLRRLSILKLAEQYLAFVSQARSRRIDLAADYLVMAAWLAFLKSRLLLPRAERPKDGPPATDLAAGLAWRLRRLDAMRRASAALHAQPQSGLDVFARGSPEELAVSEIPIWQAGLYDLLSAYARQRAQTPVRVHEVKAWPVWPLDAARDRLVEKLPEAADWTPLGRFAPDPARFRHEPPSAASRYASLMAASLELAKQGRLSLRQLSPSEPLHIKAGSETMAP